MRSLGAGLTVLLYFPNEKNTLFDAFWGRFPYLLLPSTTIIYVKVGKVDKGGHILSRFLSSSKNKALRLERPHWCNTRLPTLQRFNRAESWESAAICTAGVVAPVDALGPDWATSQSQDLWSDGIPQIPFTYMYIVYLYIYVCIMFISIHNPNFRNIPNLKNQFCWSNWQEPPTPTSDSNTLLGYWERRPPRPGPSFSGVRVSAKFQVGGFKKMHV